MKRMNMDLIDITNSNQFTIDKEKKSTSIKSNSTCSSRTSHTDENDLENDKNSSENDCNDCNNSNNNDNMDSDVSETNSENSQELEEEHIWLKFPKFPVQIICTENCEETFDNFIINNELSNDEWFSAFMQIIMILITYQKMFSFTHNDLHTNNIMYIPTNKKFIYYCYKKKYYKVPTHGKIYKIIDFGRAIYKFKGKTFCSDSFNIGGDASTQYNTEPYFNEKKSRLEPNFSFDLCRLACSIFDYVIDDFDSIKNINDCDPFIKLIVEWCSDDSKINILYKNNGVERYPDFKLYKMISRHVHNHVPQAQLERPEFSKFMISQKNINKIEEIINIDEMPIYIL